MPAASATNEDIVSAILKDTDMLVPVDKERGLYSLATPVTTTGVTMYTDLSFASFNMATFPEPSSVLVVNTITRQVTETKTITPTPTDTSTDTSTEVVGIILPDEQEPKGDKKGGKKGGKKKKGDKKGDKKDDKVGKGD